MKTNFLSPLLAVGALSTGTLISVTPASAKPVFVGNISNGSNSPITIIVQKRGGTAVVNNNIGNGTQNVTVNPAPTPVKPAPTPVKPAPTPVKQYAYKPTPVKKYFAPQSNRMGYGGR